MPFFGTVTERGFRKKIPKHGNIYKMMQDCAPDFSRKNHVIRIRINTFRTLGGPEKGRV